MCKNIIDRFCDCSHAKQVWNLVCPVFVHNSGDTPLISWLDTNIRDERRLMLMALAGIRASRRKFGTYGKLEMI